MANKPGVAQKFAAAASDLHSHLADVLLELKQALVGKGASTPINDSDKAVDTLGDANVVGHVARDYLLKIEPSYDISDAVSLKHQ